MLYNYTVLGLGNRLNSLNILNMKKCCHYLQIVNGQIKIKKFKLNKKINIL